MAVKIKATLFDIVGEYQALYEMATDEEQDDQVFQDTLESIMGELEVKSAGYVAVLDRLEAEMKRADEISKAYAAVKKSREKSIKRMKDTLLFAMNMMEKTEIPAGELTIKVVPNGGVEPLVIDGDVPDNMTKITIEPDKEKIRAYLEAGNECEYAHLEPRGKHISIK